MSKRQPFHARVPESQRLPKAAQAAPAAKAPRSAGSPNFYDSRPSWRVGGMELVDPFGWHRVDGETLHHIRGKLAQFETMTWSEILVHAKKQNHAIEIPDLCKEARQRLEERKLLLDKVVSLRLSARERVFGYLENGVLVLLWWDPAHQVCPSLRD